MSARKNREWPEKAYKNLAFLNSSDARPIRVLCEFIEPQSRFRKLRVRDTIVFFGSARAEPREVAERRIAELRARFGGGKVPAELEAEYRRAENTLRLSVYYEDAVRLAEKLTEWSMSIPKYTRRFIVCSGGGPGIMEAANRGAQQAGGHSIGLNVSLPHEQKRNPYQTKDLAFEFHYFFIRKFWFVYLAKALVVFPGGFGTMDELFELLTLTQTKKTQKYMPIVVYGSEFWKKLINFDMLVDCGVIHEEDLNLFRFFDDVDGAFEYLKEELTRHHLKR